MCPRTAHVVARVFLEAVLSWADQCGGRGFWHFFQKNEDDWKRSKERPMRHCPKFLQLGSLLRGMLHEINHKCSPSLRSFSLPLLKSSLAILIGALMDSMGDPLRGRKNKGKIKTSVMPIGCKLIAWHGRSGHVFQKKQHLLWDHFKTMQTAVSQVYIAVSGFVHKALVVHDGDASKVSSKGTMKKRPLHKGTKRCW